MTTLPLPVRSTAARPWYDRWFEPEFPGPATLAEHVLATGRGQWWTDDPRAPRVVLVRSGSQRVLRGDPDLMPQSWVPLLARGQVSAPPRFAPVLAAAFASFAPWRRTVLALWDSPAPPRHSPEPSDRLRRLRPSDTPSLAGADPTLHWTWETWGSAEALAGSGCAWGAFDAGRLVSVACTYLHGRDHEDIAVATTPAHRRRGLAAALAAHLSADIRHRGRDATWTAPTSNTSSLALAAALGFCAVGTQTAYWVGDPATPVVPPTHDARQGRVKAGAAPV